MHYIAMNRFKVAPENEEAFKQRWLTRDVYLHTVPGFVSFYLLRGPETPDHVLYVSHTIWNTKEDFENWTRSAQFRSAHASAGQGVSLTTGPNQFEGFEVLQAILPDGQKITSEVVVSQKEIVTS